MHLKEELSLGALDSNGCKYTAEGGILQVSKGALVVMKGKRVGIFFLAYGEYS